MNWPDVSLKSLLPYLAIFFDTTEFALYERQRALVRAGLIHAVPGRGAGKGVRVTPHSLAMLLISLAATESLIQVESETKAIANLKSQDNTACPLTGKKTFGAALSAVLSSVDLDRRLAWIDVVRGGKRRMAELVLRKEPGTYYTEDQLRQLGAAGTLPNREKLHGTIDSRFGDRDARFGGPLVIRASLFLPPAGLAHNVKEISK